MCQPGKQQQQQQQQLRRIRIRTEGGRGAARARGRARGRRAPPQPVAAGRRPVVPAGQGEKNIDNAFIRNRGRYKIKRIMPAARNVEVKHRGQTVRQMVARRRAIYPNLQPQQDY